VTLTGIRHGMIEIVPPRIAKPRSDIVQSSLECHAPLDLTWSCYREEQQACESCVLRLRAFQTAGVPDPIAYAQNAGIFADANATASEPLR